VGQIHVPALEKMLVDMISDKETYRAQETEAAGIFKAAEKLGKRGGQRYWRR